MCFVGYLSNVMLQITARQELSAISWHPMLNSVWLYPTQLNCFIKQRSPIEKHRAEKNTLPKRRISSDQTTLTKKLQGRCLPSSWGKKHYTRLAVSCHWRCKQVGIYVAFNASHRHTVAEYVPHEYPIYRYRSLVRAIENIYRYIAVEHAPLA